MGFLSQRVKRSELEAGDHIYTWRTAYIYSHHGIYVGGDKVVHFTQMTQHQDSDSGGSTSLCSSSSVPKVQSSSSGGSTSLCSSSSLPKVQSSSSGGSTSFFSSSSVPKIAAACLDFEDCGLKKHASGVVKSCLSCFLGNGSLYRFEYGVSGLTLVTKLRSGTCTTAKSDPIRDVIHRALYLLENGYGKYDVLTNNCEDFALYCKTGFVIFSRNVSEGNCSGQAFSVAGVPASLILSLPSKIFSSNPYVFGATTLGNYTFGRYVTDVGVRENVLKVEVELLAAFRGDLPADEDACADGSICLKFCNHDVGAELLTSHTDANPYRRYYCCRQREGDDCGFFEWIDAELPEFQKRCVLNLKAERDWLDGTLKYKEDMEILMSERLELKSLELEATKKVNIKAQGMVVELEITLAKAMTETKALSKKLAVSTFVNLMILIPVLVALYCGCLTSKGKFGV